MTDLRQITGLPIHWRQRLLAFLAALTALFFEKAGLFYLSWRGQLLQPFLVVAGILAGYVIAGLILCPAVSRLAADAGPETAPADTGKSKAHTGISEWIARSLAFSFNSLFGLMWIWVLRWAIPVLLEFAVGAAFFAAIALAVLAIIGTGICVLTGYQIARQNARLSGYPLYLIRGVKSYFTRFPYLLLNFATVAGGTIVILLLEKILWPALFAAGFSPLLIVFYQLITWASLGSAVYLFLTKAARVIYQDMPLKEPEKASSLACVLPILFAAVIVGLILPPNGNPIVSEYENMLGKAESYRAADQLYLCGNEYKQAYALMKAYKGYLLDMQSQKDRKATDEEKRSAANEADILFSEAYSFYPNAGKIYYLDALRNLDRDPDTALNQLNLSIHYDPNFTDSYFVALTISKKQNQKEETKKFAAELVRNGLLMAPKTQNDLSYRRITAELAKMDEHFQVCLENITTIACDYYNNQLYNEALQELMLIKDVLPNDVAVNYLIAMTDLEMKEDRKDYRTAIEAARTILDQYPDEKWAQELYAGIALRAGDQTVLDEALKTAYEQNPDDLDIAEQYAYSLLKQNSESAYLDVTAKAETVVDKILGTDSQRWFAVYCKALIELYKGDYESSIQHLNTFSDLIIEDKSLFSIYDNLFNIYAQKYARRMTLDNLAVATLQNSDNLDAFTYNYIYAFYGTMNSDIEASTVIDCLNRAIAFNPKFARPYYMLGNVYMELGARTGDVAMFAQAEDYYYQSIARFETDPYAWFALGHAFKKQGKYEAAIGAFKKTLTLMPAEDHASDHFGVSIHSSIQIEEIEKLIAQKGGE